MEFESCWPGGCGHREGERNELPFWNTDAGSMMTRLHQNMNTTRTELLSRGDGEYRIKGGSEIEEMLALTFGSWDNRHSFIDLKCYMLRDLEDCILIVSMQYHTYQWSMMILSFDLSPGLSFDLSMLGWRTVRSIEIPGPLEFWGLGNWSQRVAHFITCIV